MTADINIQSKKIELIQWLSTTEDLSIVDKVLDLMQAERKKDWWSDTSSFEKKSIEKGIQDADNERLNSHQKAKDLYEKWL